MIGEMLRLYDLKRAMMYPRKLYMRRREGLEPGFLRSALELHYYRPAFYRWMGAVSENPDLLYEADLASDDVVLDIGAYTGEWAEKLLEGHSAKVLAFEPDPRNFSKLAKKSKSNPSLTALAYGLGSKDESVAISLEFMGSTIYPGKAKADGIKYAEACIRDIAGAWQELGLEQVALMKINIEGAEFPLLERMIEADLLRRVDCFLIQFHEWHPGAYGRRKRIRRALSQTHSLNWDYHFVWEKWSIK